MRCGAKEFPVFLFLPKLQNILTSSNKNFPRHIAKPMLCDVSF
ncbi:hypothetical protein BHF72_2011 [Cloacibacterium normanense]|uniref:Uncharacterized protein n=1 Tax=Cloacibacterium normanense TaxID=237258 RepID=A0A1E5UF51_9FLAO|nr:hypothetical protein BHF72_2011 [Cloacibacterium normanense]